VSSTVRHTEGAVLEDSCGRQEGKSVVNTLDSTKERLALTDIRHLHTLNPSERKISLARVFMLEERTFKRHPVNWGQMGSMALITRHFTCISWHNISSSNGIRLQEEFPESEESSLCLPPWLTKPARMESNQDLCSRSSLSGLETGGLVSTSSNPKSKPSSPASSPGARLSSKLFELC